MIRIAIVEDDAMYADQLKQYLQQYGEENRELLEVTVYTDGDQIVEKYHLQFDIILMDIEMKFVDGMTAAEEIRRIDMEAAIIFVTNVAQYAIRGYRLSGREPGGKCC